MIWPCEARVVFGAVRFVKDEPPLCHTSGPHLASSKVHVHGQQVVQSRESPFRSMSTELCLSCSNIYKYHPSLAVHFFLVSKNGALLGSII